MPPPDAVMTRDTDRLQDGAGRDDHVGPVRLEQEPLDVALKRQDAVAGHRAEVGAHHDPIHDVPEAGAAELEQCVTSYSERCRAYIFPVVINSPNDVSVHAR